MENTFQILDQFYSRHTINFESKLLKQRHVLAM